MTPELFISDAAKGLLVAAVLGLPLAAAVLWLMGSAGQYWCCLLYTSRCV